MRIYSIWALPTKPRSPALFRVISRLMRLVEAKRLPFHIQQQFPSNVTLPNIRPYKFVLGLNETEGTNSTTSIWESSPGSVAVALALQRSPSFNSAAWLHQSIHIWVWKWLLLPVSSKNSIVNFRLTHSGSLEINRPYEFRDRLPIVQDQVPHHLS